MKKRPNWAKKPRQFHRIRHKKAVSGKRRLGFHTNGKRATGRGKKRHGDKGETKSSKFSAALSEYDHEVVDQGEKASCRVGFR